MNLTEESNQTSPQQTVFGYSCPSTQWSQVPPQYMPWGHTPNSPPAPLVTFNAEPQQDILQSSFSQIDNIDDPQPSTSRFGQISIGHCKRKANLDIPVPRKQHITEEKMAAHMSRLHISTENHNEQMSQAEDSLSKQKRLYVCEEMRRLQTESILPSSLLGRLERPCMAVMLWQPPAKIPSLVSSSEGNINAAVATVGVVHRNLAQEDENDNNVDSVNLNNMEMDS